MSARATIIIVSYNTCELLRACLASLRQYAPGYPVIVVDNASSDGSVAMVTREFPAVDIRRNDRNLGFGAANNRALADVHTEFTLLLNPDTRLEDDVIAALASTLDAHPQAAAVGCRLVSADRITQRSARRFPSARRSLRNALGLVDPIPTALTSVDYVDGAAVLLRTPALHAVHGFDEDFFLYAEDADLCRRLHAAGWTVLYDPRVSIMHLGGGSTERGGAADDRWRWQGLHRYALRHFGPAAFAAFVIARGIELLRQALANGFRALVFGDPESRRAFGTALRHLRWHPSFLRRRPPVSGAR